MSNEMLLRLTLLLTLAYSSHSAAQSFQIQDVRLGDSTVNYVNPEISPSENYLLWIELDTSNGFFGTVWHCGLDPQSGALIPPDGKGFNAFRSNVYGRPADWGEDALGPYYIGLNTAGEFVFVRPTQPQSGTVQVLSTPPDLKRRVIYPSQLPDTNKRFITYILNESQAVGANNPANSNFELKFLDLDHPTNPLTIERQSRTFPAAVGMDVLVPRWIKGTPFLTYGFYDTNNFVQVKEFDAFNPTAPALPVSADPSVKADGYPVNNPFNGKQYLISGLNGTDSALVYRRNNPGQMFNPVETVVPSRVNLSNPALNQSHEPFFFQKQLYTTFQVNENGGSFVNTTLNEPGEIWITSIDSSRQVRWLISEFDPQRNVSEPEPYSGQNKIFVYYSANIIDSSSTPLNRIFQLRRCATPFASALSKPSPQTEVILNVYPNPTRGKLHIEADQQLNYTLYNAQGAVLFTGRGNQQVELADRTTGPLFLIAEGPGLWLSEKIILSEAF